MSNDKVQVSTETRTNRGFQISYDKAGQQVKKAIDNGHVVLMQAFSNSNPEQITLQFMQQKSVDTPGELIALGQGIDPEQIGINRVTVLFSFNRKHAEENFGITDGDYSQEEAPILAPELFNGIPVGIQVTESYSPSRFRQEHQPKLRPNDGSLIMNIDPADATSKPVYRHTELKKADEVNDQFISDYNNAVMNGEFARQYTENDMASIANGRAPVQTNISKKFTGGEHSDEDFQG